MKKLPHMSPTSCSPEHEDACCQPRILPERPKMKPLHMPDPTQAAGVPFQGGTHRRRRRALQAADAFMRVEPK